MWKISIENKGENINEWIFEVNLKNNEGKFSYKVFVSKDYYRDLTNTKIPPITLVERSYTFLLNKEKASEILKQFNIKEISDYFTEYESSIKKTLS